MLKSSTAGKYVSSLESMDPWMISAGNSIYTGPGVPYIDIFTAFSIINGIYLILVTLTQYFVTGLRQAIVSNS